jgi:Predicted hydrolase of the metallo-beta-lactamase superfamily
MALFCVEKVPSGRLALDGRRLIAAAGNVFHDRHRLMSTGHALITLVLTKNNTLKCPPTVLLIGVADYDHVEELTAHCVAAVEEAFLSLPLENREHDGTVSDAVRAAARRVLSNYYGKKTLTHVQVLRVT